LKSPSYTEKDLDVTNIVRKHEGLVRRIAFRMHAKVSSFVELDDLLQSGLEGLVDAAQKYTSVEGASFENYASIRIKGSILDLIRRSGNLNRSTVQAKQMIESKKAELSKELGRSPTDEESLSQVYDEFSMVFAAPTIEPERLIDSKALRGTLVEALKSLPIQQSRVLQLYYVEELNVYEIAQVLDLSPGRVSQVKSEAFKTLKSTLGAFTTMGD
jgi:RNA polymerase sigma factor for flagellar operon FliA